MKKEKININSFIKRKHLVERVSDMLEFFCCQKLSNLKYETLNDKIKNKLIDITFLETLIKYFEQKYKSYYKKIEIRCNLEDLIYDLNYLKQYISSK